MTVLIAFFPLLPLLIISIPVLIGIINEMALGVTWPFFIVLSPLFLAIIILFFGEDDRQND